MGGCASDKDCKHQRICDHGRCVWPTPPAPSPGARDRERPDAADTPPAAPAAVTQSAGPPKAMFRLGPQHQGRTPFVLPARKPEVRWTYETRGPVTSSPAVLRAGAPGAVIVGSHDSRVHLVGAQGEALWSFATGDLVFGSPAVGADGVVYIGSDDDHLYALDLHERRARWKLRIGACKQSVGVGPQASRCDVDAGPTIGPDGTLYTGGDGIYAIRPDGTVLWKYLTGGHVSSAPALLPDGTVVAGCQDNLLYAIAPDGTKRWDFRAGDDIESSPAVGDDGTVYVGADDQKLYAINPQGALVWAFSATDDIRASPAIGVDGTIYVGAFDSLFYAVRPDGTLAWTFRAGDRILSSALVDPSGAVLFGSQDDRLYALEPDGRHRWSVELGGDVDSSPALAPDGTIYVGADDHKLYALRAP